MRLGCGCIVERASIVRMMADPANSLQPMQIPCPGKCMRVLSYQEIIEAVGTYNPREPAAAAVYILPCETVDGRQASVSAVQEERGRYNQAAPESRDMPDLSGVVQGPLHQTYGRGRRKASLPSQRLQLLVLPLSSAG